MEWNFRQQLSITAIWLLWFKAPGFSEALRCYSCYSNISWDDCAMRLKEFKCPERVDEVCVKEYQEPRPAVNNGSSSPEIFSKHCGVIDECTHKQCAVDGKKCVYECCSSDQCNAATPATTFTSHGMLVVSLLARSVALFMNE